MWTVLQQLTFQFRETKVAVLRALKIQSILAELHIITTRRSTLMNSSVDYNSSLK